MDNPEFSGPGLWAPRGPVAAAYKAIGLPYTRRAGQMQMAGIIEEALWRQETQPCGIVPIEAATGTGKTAAYLIPGALHAAERSSRLLISTHTIALGAQILHREGRVAQHVVEAALGKRLTIAHMCGIRNFVSPSRALALGNMRRDDGLPKPAWGHYIEIARLGSKACAIAAEHEHKDDLSGSEAQELIEQSLLDRIEDAVGVPLDRDEICLLASSPDDERAVYALGQRRAKGASILITTHAYTAISLARKALMDAAESPFDMLVVDEADQWASAAASVALVSVSMNDLLKCAGAVAESCGKLQAALDVAEQANQAVEILKSFAPKAPNSVETLPRGDLAIGALDNAIGRIGDLIQMASRRRSHTASASGTLHDRLDDLKRLHKAVTDENDFWLPRWTTSRVRGYPSLEVTGRAPGRILKRLWAGTRDGGNPLARTVVLTSATLSTPGFKVESRWKAIETATGAEQSSGMVLSDLAAQIEPETFGTMRVKFADPRAPVPRIGDADEMSPEALDYQIAVIKAAMDASAEINGRTLVLVPSYSDVKRLAHLLPSALAHIQGVPLQKILAAYRATPGCCLITPGAWVGADLPGMIQNLVIPRLSFVPSGPGRDHIDDFAFRIPPAWWC